MASWVPAPGNAWWGPACCCGRFQQGPGSGPAGRPRVAGAGGVAPNGRLRQLVNDGAQKLGAKVYLPELKFCGDNGAMIAAQGYYQYIAGHTAGLELNGLPTLPIDYE